MEEISKNLDTTALNELGVRMQIKEEAERFRRLQCVAGSTAEVAINPDKINIRNYAKHLLAEGDDSEKRKFLSNVRSMLIYRNKKIEVMS